MKASCHYLKKEPGSVLCLQSYQLLYPWTHGFPPKAPYRSKKLAKGRQTNKWFVASFSFPAGPLQQSLLWLQQQQQQQQQQRRQSYNLSEMMIFSKTAFLSFSLRPFLDLSKKEKVVVLSAQCGDTAVGFFSFYKLLQWGSVSCRWLDCSWMIACVVFSKHKINCISQNKTSFIRDRCCHLMFCLRLILQLGYTCKIYQKRNCWTYQLRL